MRQYIKWKSLYTSSTDAELHVKVPDIVTVCVFCFVTFYSHLCSLCPFVSPATFSSTFPQSISAPHSWHAQPHLFLVSLVIAAANLLISPSMLTFRFSQLTSIFHVIPDHLCPIIPPCACLQVKVLFPHESFFFCCCFILTQEVQFYVWVLCVSLHPCVQTRPTVTNIHLPWYVIAQSMC